MNINRKLKKTAAIFVLCTFLAGDFMPANLFAASEITSRTSSVSRELKLTELKIPRKTGTVQEIYQPEKISARPAVVLIQDAHAIPEAQQNIRKTILYFQKQYGADLIALEGAASRLDARIFKSFPEKEKLKKVLYSYAREAEVTGGTLAALLDDSQAEYTGIEDWDLYQQGISDYLLALKSEKEISGKLHAEQTRLTEEKKKIYSPALLEADAALQEIRNGGKHFLKAFETLSKIKQPENPSLLASLLSEMESFRKDDGRLRKEAIQLWDRLANQPVKIPASLNRVKQSFDLGEISAAQFALEIEKTYKRAIPQPGELSAAVSHLRKLEALKGPELIDALDAYGREVENSLLEKEPQRDLARRSREMHLAAKISRLELTRSEWEEVKSLRGKEAIWESLKAHRVFYENAEERDGVFLEKIEALLKKREKMTAPALLVAGGFHTQGMARRLKEKEIPYAVISPAISKIPGETNYRKQMRGDVSWKNYFQEQKEKVSLYDAFVRGVRDRLLETQSSPVLVKQWRDKIILDLASENRLEKAGSYTRFLDEISEPPAETREGLTRLKQFTQGLQKLETDGQFTKANILQLFQSAKASTPTLVNSPAMLTQDKALARLVRGEPLRFSLRAEGRTRWEDLKFSGIPAKTLLITVRESSQVAERMEAFYKLRSNWSRLPEEVRAQTAFYIFSDPDSKLRQMVIPQIIRLPDVQEKLEAFIRSPVIYAGDGRDPRLPDKVDFNPQIARYLARTAALFILFGKKNYMMGMNILKRELPQWDAEKEKRLIGLYNALPVGVKSHIREAPLGVDAPLSVLESLRLYQIWRLRRYEDLPNGIDSAEGQKAANMSFYTGESIDNWFPKELLEEDSDEEGEPVNPELHVIQTTAAKIIHAPAARAETRDQPEDTLHYEGLIQYYEAFLDSPLFPENKKAELRRSFAGLSLENYADRIPQLTKAIIAASMVGLNIAAQYDELLLQSGVPKSWRPGTPLLGKARFNMAKLSDTKRATDYIRQFSEGGLHYAVAIADSYYESKDPEAGLRAALSAFPLNPSNAAWVQERRASMFPQLRRLGWYNLAEQIARQYTLLPSQDISRENFMIWMAMLQRQSLFHFPEDVQNTAISSIRAAVQQISDIQAAATLPADELAFRITSKKALLIELAASLIAKGDKESLMEALRLLDESAILGAAPSSYSLLGFYASRALMILTAEEAASAGWSRLMSFRRTGPTPDDYEQRAESYLNVYIDQYLPTLLEGSLDLRERWREYGKASLALARKNYEEADHYFALAAQTASGELKTVVLFEHSLALLKLERVQDALETARAYLQMIAIFDETDEFRDFHLASAIHFYPPGYLDQFLDIAYSILAEPRYWPEEEHRQLLKTAVRYLVRTERLTDNQVYETVTRWINLRGEDPAGLLRETPFILQMLSGMYSLSPDTVRSQVLLWAAALEVKHPEAAKMFLDFLEKESKNSLAARGTLKIATQLVLLELAKDAGNFQEFNHEASYFIQNFFVESLLASDFDASAVFRALYEVETLLQEELGYHQGLTNASLYSMAISAMTTLYASLNVEVTIETQNQTLSRLLQEKQTKLRETLVQALQEELKAGNKFYEESLSRSDELWRLTFFRIRIEALRMMNAPPAAQNNAMADYIAAYQPTAEANRRKIPNGFITTRQEAAGVFMRYLDALIMKGDYAKAGAVIAVYLPELEAAVDFLRRTDSSSPERGPFLHIMYGSFTSMHFKSLSYLLREGSALREPLRKLLEMAADISESTDTEADRSKAADLGAQIASIAALSGQMEIVSRKAQEVLELNDSLEEREISDLQGRFELYLLLAHEYGQKDLNDEKEQAEAGALRVLEAMERRFQGNSEERPWLIASQAGFLNYSGHEEDAIQHVVTERDAVETVHPQLGAYYNYVLTGFYLENGRRPEAVVSLYNYLRYRVQEASLEDRNDDNGIVTEAIFWPAGKKKNIVIAYIDVLKAHPELNNEYTERVLRSVYFLDYKTGLNEVAGYVQGVISHPVPFQENPERILTMLGWLIGTGYDPAALIDIIEKLSARPEMSKSLKDLKQAKEQLEKMTTLQDWRNVLRVWFQTGAYDEVIQRVEFLRKRKDFAADPSSHELLELQKAAKQRKEIYKQIRDIYNGGNYVKALQMYEAETRHYAKPAALDKMMQTAAVLVKAENLMKEGRWSDALTELETASPDLRDKNYAKALQSFGEFKETLAAVEAHLARKYFREAEHLLEGAVSGYREKWKQVPDVNQGNHLSLNGKIIKMKADWALAVQKLSRAQGYAEIKKAALDLASNYPEEINAAFEELVAKSVAVFNFAGETRNPQKKQETFLEAFHLGRLVYEVAAEVPPSSFSFSRADQVISQAMANYWLPQLTDDFWITHAMAEAEREKEEVHETKGTVSFTFPKGKIDFMKYIRIQKLNHSESDRSGNSVPANLKTSVEIGDTFRITPAAAPEGAPLKPLKYLFKVTAVDEKTGTLSFDIPKSLEKPEKMIPEIVAALTNGGTITRMSNNSWVNQRETLRGVIRNMKSTIVNRIDVSDLDAPVLNVSTGNPVLNRMFGLSLRDSTEDADSLRKIQQWNEDLKPVVDAYVAKEKETQAAQGKKIDFDPEQRDALMAILNPYEPVVMIQGPPGTGKTTVLKAAIRLLMQLRQGVLVTSQQNHAIDKVVLKTLEGAGPEEAWLKKLVRTASNAEGITHEDILRIYGERIQRLQAIEKEDESRGPGPAVAGTAVGLTQDRELRKLQKAVRKLKTGIMDESSRATRAESLHLLIYFDALTRLISVGDPFQLPAYGVTKDDVAFVAQWLGKGPLQDDEMGSREFAEVFKYHRRKNFKISLFEKTLGLFLDETQGIDKGIFSVTTPPFFYFDVNRRFSGWLLIKHSNYFYGKRKPLRTEKTEPGYFQLDDTEGLSPEADSNGRYPLGAVPTNERAEIAGDEDETYERYNLGEVDRSIYWVNHFINQRGKSPEKIAVITPFRRQVTEIKKSVLDIAKLHAYLRAKEAGENPSEDRLLTVTVERYYRTRVYLQNLAGFRSRRTPTRDQGALIDSAASRLSVEYRELTKDKSSAAKEKARAFREKLGLGENFVKVTPGGKIEMDVRVVTPRKKGRSASAELDDELEGMKTVTVDSSIGDEWEGVIVSWVRSNAQNEVGFLADEEGAQRRNVADSRGAELVQIMDVRTFIGNKNRNEKSRPSEVAEWAQHKLDVAREARTLIGDDSLQARHESRIDEIFNTVYLKGEQVPDAVKDAYRSLIPLELLNQLGIPAGTKLPVYGDEDAGGENEWAIYLKPLGKGHFRIDLARSKAEVAVNEDNPFDDKVFLADIALRMREDGTLVIETPGRVASFAEANVRYPSVPSATERAFIFWVENYLVPFAVQTGARSIEMTQSYISTNALVQSRFVKDEKAAQFSHVWVRTEGLQTAAGMAAEPRNEIREIADNRQAQAAAAIGYLNQLPAGPKINIYVYNQDSNGVFGGAYLLAREIRHRIKNAFVRMLLVDGRMPSAFRGITNGIDVEQEFKPHLEQGILKDSDFNFIVAGSKAYKPPPLPPQATVTTGGYFSRDFHESVFSKNKPAFPIHMDFTDPRSTVQLVTENREAIEKKDQMSFEELAAAKEDWHRRLARDRDRLQGEEQLQSLLQFSEKNGWKPGASIMTWTYYKDYTYVFKEIEKLARAAESGTLEEQQIWAPDGRQILIHASISSSQEIVSMMRLLEEKEFSYISPLGEIHEGRLPVTVVFHERISHAMMQELQVLSGTMKRDEEENRWIGFPAWPTGWGSSLETMSLGTPWLHDRFDAGEKEFDNAFYALLDNVLKLQAGRSVPAEISGMNAEEVAEEFFLGSERKAARYEDLKAWSRLSRWLSDSLYQMNMVDDLAIELAKQKGFIPARSENREDGEKSVPSHVAKVEETERQSILEESLEWELKLFLDGKIREEVSHEVLEQGRTFYDQINPWEWRDHEHDQERKRFHQDLRLILAEQKRRSTVQFEYVDLIAHQLTNFLNNMQLLGIRTDNLPGHVHEQAEELYRYLTVRVDKAKHVMTAKKLSKEEEAADLTNKTTELLMDINRLSTGWKFRKFLKELKEIDDPAFQRKAKAAADTLEKTSTTAAEFSRAWLGIEAPKVSDVDLGMAFTRVMRAHPDLREAGKLEKDLQDLYSIRTYEVYFTEVLLNFLNNAAQALPPASERLRKNGDVLVTARKIQDPDRDPELEIVIQDKGLGISPEHVQNILAMKQFTTKETGHGLGMPRAIGLAEGPLQGSFQIESEVGKGTKITLRFPLALRAEGRQVDRAMESFSNETDKARRIELARQMGVDNRLSLANYMDPAYVGYSMAVKQQVNPENRPLTAVYGGAGAGWPIFALSTNATDVYMVDTVKQMNPLKLEALYQQWNTLDITPDMKNPFDMTGMHYKTGFGSVIKFALYGLEPSIMEGLKAAGVSRTRADGSRNIQFQALPDGSVKIQFHWAYPGEEEKLYTLTYVDADITQPAEYPQILQERLKQGIDLYYQRAALDIPEVYAGFLPQIAAAVRSGGFLVTDDHSTNLGTGRSRKNNPDAILRRAGENRWGKTGEITTPSMDGFGEAIKALRRRGLYQSSTDDEIRYGWHMEIRPKLGDIIETQSNGSESISQTPPNKRSPRSESRLDPEVEAELKELLLSAPVFYERKGIGRVVDLSKLSIPREKDYLLTSILIRLKFLQISRIPERILRGTKPLLRSVRDQEGYKTLIFVTEQGGVDGFLLSRNYEGAWRGFTQMDWIISDENAVSGAGTLLMDSWLEELKKNEVTLATWIYRPESLGFFTPYLESRGLPSSPMDAQRFSLGAEILKSFSLPQEIKVHTTPRAEMRELADSTARFILSGETASADNLSGKISELKTEGVSVKQFAALTDEAGLRIESEQEQALAQTAFDWMNEVMEGEGTLAAAFDVPASEKSILEAALARLQGKSASRWVAFVPQSLGEVNSGSMLTQRVRDLDRYKPVYAIRNVQIQNADRVARIRLGSPQKSGTVNPNLFYVSPNGSIASMDPALQRVIELAAGMMVGGVTAREIKSTTDLQTSPEDIEQRVLAALLKGDYEDLIPQGKGLLSIGTDGSIRIEMPVFSSLLQQVQSRREMAQSA